MHLPLRGIGSSAPHGAMARAPLWDSEECNSIQKVLSSEFWMVCDDFFNFGWSWHGWYRGIVISNDRLFATKKYNAKHYDFSKQTLIKKNACQNTSNLPCTCRNSVIFLKLLRYNEKPLKNTCIFAMLNHQKKNQKQSFHIWF